MAQGGGRTLANFALLPEPSIQSVEGGYNSSISGVCLLHRMSARDAKNGFGKLIDLARAEPVAIEKYGRSVVIVMAVEEYERLSGKTEGQRPGTEPATSIEAKT
jgi:prevent-host-death family protein